MTKCSKKYKCALLDQIVLQVNNLYYQFTKYSVNELNIFQIN